MLFYYFHSVYDIREPKSGIRVIVRQLELLISCFNYYCSFLINFMCKNYLSQKQFFFYDS